MNTLNHQNVRPEKKPEAVFFTPETIWGSLVRVRNCGIIWAWGGGGGKGYLGGGACAIVFYAGLFNMQSSQSIICDGNVTLDETVDTRSYTMHTTRRKHQIAGTNHQERSTCKQCL